MPKLELPKETPMQPTTKALLVMLLDERIRTFLMLNDPKAIKQALCACKLVDDIPREMHLKLNEVAEQVGEIQKAVRNNRRKNTEGSSIGFVIGIEKGCFTIRTGGSKRDSCDLNAGALARMLVKAGYNARNEHHFLSRSSSIDFPEDDGAPRGFDAHEALRDAILLAMRP